MTSRRSRGDGGLSWDAAGQLAFLRAHLPWPLAGQLMMAAALESIAVYPAFHAHVAALANDSAPRLRLAERFGVLP
jgi:hypothetical protein